MAFIRRISSLTRVKGCCVLELAYQHPIPFQNENLSRTANIQMPELCRYPFIRFSVSNFFTSIMANRSEIIAILGNGISFPRFLRPFFVGGIILSAFLWWCNQSILPKANAKWAYFSAKYIDETYAGVRSQSFISNFYFRLDSLSYAGIRYYDTINRTGNSFLCKHFAIIS